MSKPKIRVKGYKDDWEQRKLSDIYGSIGNAFVGTATPYYAEQGHFYLESNNVKDGQINHNSEIFINDEFYEKQKDKWLHSGDMVMVQSGHVGHAAVIPEELDNTAAHALIMFRNPKEEIEPYFLNYEYQTDKAKRKIENITTGNTIKHILASDMQEFVVDVPKYEEQKVIAGYFRNIDHLITLHHRKLNSSSKRETFAWEQRKLGDLVDRVTRKNQDLVSELPLTISAQHGLIDQNEFFDKRVASKDVSGYYLIENGEFAYNKSTSTDAPWGAIKRLDRYENGVLSTLYIVFGIKENNPVDSDFLVSYYSTNLWHKGIHEIAAEGARNHGLLNIAPADFFETKLMIPQDIEEQKKIGEYLDHLDHLITLHQRKCDETKKLKKYMLQKMFPQNGNKVPEIRFFGFTDDWEQRKFNEFVKNVAKKNKDNLDLEPFAVTNDRGFIAQKDAHEDFGYMKDTDRRAYNIVPPNSFAYNPARINVGSLGYYAGTENVIVSSLYEVFQTEDFIDDRFLWHWLKSEHFPKWIEKLQEGSVRLYFYFDKLIQCQMMIPSVEEQKIISEYLDRIDTLITLHHRKYEELQKIKKFMLQNMFV